MFSLGDFLYFSYFSGGARGVWVATKWDFLGGGGSCLVHSQAKAKTGNSFRGGVCSNLNLFGACLIHIS